MKNIWCIRHGTALHNVLFSKIGTKAYTLPKYRDTPLVEKGNFESLELGKTWDKKENIEIIFVSPLTRTLQTANNIFKDSNIIMMANDDIIEHPQSLDQCNNRLSKVELKVKYPNVDFSNIPEKSTYWKDSPNVEPFFDLKERSDHFKQMLKERPEKNICVVSHNTFLKEFLFSNKYGLETLHHCSPYLFKL
jgi:broad specificity phosphatase PhoE